MRLDIATTFEARPSDARTFEMLPGEDNPGNARLVRGVIWMACWPESV